MARGLGLVSYFLAVVSLLLSLMIVNDFSPAAEARPLKISRSNKDYAMVKEIEGTVSMAEKSTTNTTSAPDPDEERHEFHIFQTMKWSNNSGPSPGGHKNNPAGSNQ